MRSSTWISLSGDGHEAGDVSEPLGVGHGRGGGAEGDVPHAAVPVHGAVVPGTAAAQSEGGQVTARPRRTSRWRRGAGRCRRPVRAAAVTARAGRVRRRAGRRCERGCRRRRRPRR